MQIIKSASRPYLLEGNVPGRSVNASQLERWLGGSAELERISAAMRDWYAGPIALDGVPGKVYAYPGGDFRGELRAGFEASWKDRALDIKRRLDRGIRHASKSQRTKFHAFTSLSDLIAEATGGKKRDFFFSKTGITKVANSSYSLWQSAGRPAAGAAGAAAPGGTAHVDSDTGAFVFANPAGGDTQHLVSANSLGTVVANSLLLYDRLTSVAPSVTIATNQSVTTTPTRYQSGTSGAADYIGGNFVFIETHTTIGAVAHTWNGQYTDQDSNAAQAFTQVTGISACVAQRFDMATTSPEWFMRLAGSDVGVKQLTQVTLSASVTSGAINFVTGHPLAWMPVPVANMICNFDFINTAFNLTRIFDDACMALLEINAPSTTATTYTGQFTTVAG